MRRNPYDFGFSIEESSYDTIGSSEHIGWNSQSDLLGGFQINNQLELRRLLDGEIGGLGPFKYLVHIRSGATVQVGEVNAIEHESSGFHISAPLVHHWQPAPYREFCNLFTIG